MISRTYIVSYYKEVNDECVDREMEIVAENIPDAIEKMKGQVRVFSRIFRVEEKPLGREKLSTNFERLNFPGLSNYPRVKEIVPLGNFKVDIKDENFDKPLSNLEKEY
jgi:hypothetical protein